MPTWSTPTASTISLDRCDIFFHCVDETPPYTDNAARIRHLARKFFADQTPLHIREALFVSVLKPVCEMIKGCMATFNAPVTVSVRSVRKIHHDP